MNDWLSVHTHQRVVRGWRDDMPHKCKDPSLNIQSPRKRWALWQISMIQLLLQQDGKETGESMELIN